MEQVKDEEMLKFPRQKGKSEETPDGPANGPHIQAVEFQQFDGSEPPSSASERDRKLDLLLGLTLPVSIELGRTELEIRSVLDLKRGSIIEFDKMASEPVDIVVNGKKMAEGEVVVIDKHFAIRVTNLVNTSERIKGLGA